MDNWQKIYAGKIYIYGAGAVGQSVLKQLKKCSFHIKAFLVSGKSESRNCIENIPVLSVDEVEIEKTDIVLIAVSNTYMEEIEKTLIKKQIYDYIKYTSRFFPALHRKYMRDLLAKEYFEDTDYAVEAQYGGIGKYDTETGMKYHFRFLLDENIYTVPHTEKDLHSLDVLSDFETTYGKYNFVLPVNKLNGFSNTYRIIMACCHKDKWDIDKIIPSYIVPVQGGKALTDRKICRLTDDSGDNISARNGAYCECSTLYWAWKNQWSLETDYIGLFHYRRVMKISEKELSSLHAQGIDMVLTAPTYIQNLKEHFFYCTKNPGDWDIMREAINRIRPEYKESFFKYENQHMVCQCNMFIMRRQLFDEYSEFLFSVLNYIDNWYSAFQMRNDRYLGYLAENLLSVFAIQNKDRLKIAYTDMLTAGNRQIPADSHLAYCPRE